MVANQEIEEKEQEGSENEKILKDRSTHYVLLGFQFLFEVKIWACYTLLYCHLCRATDWVSPVDCFVDIACGLMDTCSVLGSRNNKDFFPHQFENERCGLLPD